ncbi:orotidine-5'-phosphate decarboxylase [Lacisediminihabitans sp.]|uniref:orotidine-5'-phosphate decarboxylase n=1 Tax=Lacisediminihabitans sp. TaxID=2787631 RepID=UPI00374D5DD5
MAEPATPAVVGFGDRLTAVFDKFGQLCVGIDPHAWLLQEWNLPDSAAGSREFGLRVVEAASGRVGIVKPQVAFFERHGSAGFAALEDVLAAARDAGLLVIADAKRGDLGTSVEAYGQAWLAQGSPLECDAMTISAYMGVGSIEAPMRLAEQAGKGLFVLAATSNPEAFQVQTAIVASGASAGRSVAASIVGDVVSWNKLHTSGVGGSVGVVLGATVDFSAFGIDLAGLAGAPSTPVLAPGFGHQGARYSQLASLYGPAAPHAVVSASRSILRAGPAGIADAISSQASEVLACRG